MGLCRSILPPDKTGKMDCKNGRKDKKSCQKADLMSCIKSVKFRVTAGYIHSFRIRSKETPRVMYPKYPVFDVIQRNPPPLWII